MVVMYLPLESTLLQFRLLTLHPCIPSLPTTNKESSPSVPIRCTLSTTSLRCPPPFQALSYAWGDVKDTLPIHVDENEIRVTRNLCLALEHIRHEIEDVILWVDAVCINQNDNLEKEDQVQHMTEIFASAKNTIVWLGPLENNSDRFFQRCQEVGGQLAKQNFVETHLELFGKSSECATDEAQDQILEEEIDRQIGPHTKVDLEDIPGSISCAVASHHLMHRDYWRRVWTQQEFTVSPCIMIHCGNLKVPVSNLLAYTFYLDLIASKILRVLHQRMNDFVDKASTDVREKWAQWVNSDWAGEKVVPALADCQQNWSYCQTISSLSSGPGLSFFALRHLYHRREEQIGRNTLTLIRLLCTTFVDERKEASNSKDRIYGVLGMASDKLRLGLSPEYNESIPDIRVYTKTARAIIEHGTVDLLSLSQHRRVSNKRIDPQTLSWVPDWLAPIEKPIGNLPWNTSFKASGKIQFEKLPDLARLPEDHLGLSGWVVDVVKETKPSWSRLESDFVEHRSDDLKYLMNIQQLCTNSTDILRSSDCNIYSPGSSDSENSYFKIPIADRFMNKRGQVFRANDGCKEAYSDMINGPSSLERVCYTRSMMKHRFRLPFISEIGYVGLAPDLAEVGM